MSNATDLPRKSMKEWRIEQGKTQLELANAIGVTPPTIWNIENGRNKPTSENLLAIAQALGVMVEQIIWPEVKRFPSRENRAKKEVPVAA